MRMQIADVLTRPSTTVKPQCDRSCRACRNICVLGQIVRKAWETTKMKTYNQPQLQRWKEKWHFIFNYELWPRNCFYYHIPVRRWLERNAWNNNKLRGTEYTKLVLVVSAVFSRPTVEIYNKLHKILNYLSHITFAHSPEVICLVLECFEVSSAWRQTMHARNEGKSREKKTE